MSSQGIFLSVLASILFAIISCFPKLLAPLQGLEIFAWRTLATLPCIFAFIALKRHFPALKQLVKKICSQPRYALILLSTAALIGIQNWIFMWSPLNGYALDAALGYFLVPLAMVVVGRFFYGEPLDKIQIIAILLACAGVGHEVWKLQALSWVTCVIVLGLPPYFILHEKFKLDPLASFAIEVLLLSPACLFILFSHGTALTQAVQPLHSGGLIVALGIVNMLAFACYLGASKMLSMSTFGILSYLEPALLFVCVLTFSGEHFPLSSLWTYLPIWGAIMLMGAHSTHAVHKQRRKAAAAAIDKKAEIGIAPGVNTAPETNVYSS